MWRVSKLRKFSGVEEKVQQNQFENDQDLVEDIIGNDIMYANVSWKSEFFVVTGKTLYSQKSNKKTEILSKQEKEWTKALTQRLTHLPVP